jgi:putative hydrolase of the HAD superfamily
VVARLGLEDPGLADELGEIHGELVREHVAMPDHHPGLLARLARHRRLALCSNFSHSPTALRILAERGLAEHLDPVVISDEVDSRKPARPIFEAVLERLGLPPEQAHRVLHVGDRLDADVAGAAAVGMRTAWITRSVRDRDAAFAAYDGPPPDLELRDLGELEQALEAPAAPR